MPNQLAFTIKTDSILFSNLNCIFDYNKTKDFFYKIKFYPSDLLIKTQYTF